MIDKTFGDKIAWDIKLHSGTNNIGQDANDRVEIESRTGLRGRRTCSVDHVPGDRHYHHFYHDYDDEYDDEYDDDCDDDHNF